MSTKATLEKGFTQRSHSLWQNGFRFVRTKTVDTLTGKSFYWDYEQRCGIKAITHGDNLKGNLTVSKASVNYLKIEHNHAPNFEKYEVIISDIELYGLKKAYSL